MHLGFISYVVWLGLSGLSNYWITDVFHFLCIYLQFTCKFLKTCNLLKTVIITSTFPCGIPSWSSCPTTPIWIRWSSLPAEEQQFWDFPHHLLGHLILGCPLFTGSTVDFFLDLMFKKKNTSSHSILADGAWQINLLRPYICSNGYQVWGLQNSRLELAFPQISWALLHYLVFLTSSCEFDWLSLLLLDAFLTVLPLVFYLLYQTQGAIIFYISMNSFLCSKCSFYIAPLPIVCFFFFFLAIIYRLFSSFLMLPMLFPRQILVPGFHSSTIWLLIST